MDFSQSSNRAGAPLPLIPRRTSHIRSSSASKASPSPSVSVAFPEAPTAPTEALSTSSPNSAKRPVVTSAQHDPMNSEGSSSSSSVSDGTRPTIAPRAKRQRGYKIPPITPTDSSTPAVTAAATAVSSKARSDQFLVAAASCPTSDDEAPRHNPHQTHKSHPKQKQYKNTISITRVHLEPSRPTPPESIARSKSADHSMNRQEASAPAIRVVATEEAPRMIRKKSGQVVKSSLKSSQKPERGSLSVIIGTATTTSKSEPTTPTHCKAVHFDAQLEHVKLFLAEQKPLAVSRDGSPTDTSGTDTDFPPFIYGTWSDEERAKMPLLMQVTNMPSTIRRDADVALEELKLSQDRCSIVGKIRVRNLAFEKWVAVRFTFDSWQTTSEVAAKYAESFKEGTFDRFTFSIKLNDMLTRIESKILLLALRYNSAGREIWDNNSTQNYRAIFSRMPPKLATPMSDDDEGASSSSSVPTKVVSDLKSRLEQVIDSRNKVDHTTPVRRVSSPGDIGSEASNKPPVLSTGTSLASRYDFSASLRSPWKPVPPVYLAHQRMNTHPATKGVPWPSKGPIDALSLKTDFERQSLDAGSPRDPEDAAFRIRPAHESRDPQDLPFSISPTRNRSHRNHHRGYFDIPLSMGSNVKKTPPGTPLLGPGELPHSPPRVNSFPPVSSPRLTSPKMLASPLGSGTVTPNWNGPVISVSVERQFSGGSDESTPSITNSSSSSSSLSPSPTESLVMSQLSAVIGSPTSSNNDYSELLNRFCFFTGSNSLSVPMEAISRSHSASTVEEFLSSPPPSMYGLSESSDRLSLRTRSPSFDDTLYRSGLSTPSDSSVTPAQSRSATPVAS